MPDPLYMTLMWHMHQPYYKDPFTNEYALPWTYLHAVKDYYDMAAIIDEVDGMKVVFNLVPSLLEQITDYASGGAVDPFLVRARMSPADMNAEEKLFIVKNFFSANLQRMIEPNKRYLQLFHLAGNGEGQSLEKRLRQFANRDILDLQVWFFLAWTGEAVRRRHPEIQELLHKGKDFTTADKEVLFSVHSKVLREIIPLYRRLHQQGKVELSVSPYYHPILPLLCDIRSALVATPKVILPDTKFGHPEDARAQVIEGVEYFSETFGFAPAGMWPSEGSVSDEALGIMASCGLKWTASDEEVFYRSVSSQRQSGESFYRPFSFAAQGHEIAIFFRDHALSDRIGFTYANWDTHKAVNDFIGSLKEIRKGRASAGNRVVPIILDGENAWEYYRNNGYDFLKLLYQTVASTSGLEPVTFSEALGKISERGRLSHVHAGSWINSSFGIWVGHREKNLAWDYLERARETVIKHSREAAEIVSGTGRSVTDAGHEKAMQAVKAIRIAEGSDWFWWYGEDHFSAHSKDFDRLFRENLTSAYQSLGLDPPRELFQPIKHEVAPAGLVREPTGMISPRINGIVDDYFEWLPAGVYDLSRQGSTMHQAQALMQRFFYGFDSEAFFFRFDGEWPIEKLLQQDDVISIYISGDNHFMLPIAVAEEQGPLLIKEKGKWNDSGAICLWKVGCICEVMVPLAAMNLGFRSRIFVHVTLTRNNEEIGRWPRNSSMTLTYLGPDVELENWFI